MTIRLNSKVAIIDDDLAEWRVRDFTELQSVINDSDIDEFEALWSTAVELGVVTVTDDPSTKIDRLNQDSVINSLAMTDNLRVKHPSVWNRLFFQKVEERQSDLSWYYSIKTTLDRYSAQISEYPNYPMVGELVECELLIIDLVIGDDPSPLERVTGYLKELYAAQKIAQASLPLVVLVSKNTSELEGRRQEFRHSAHISASMFRLLKKSDLSDQELGPIRFEILWSQMCDEEDIAKATRELVLSLSEAVGHAESNLRSSLWNLDCDALLRMYQTCDGDSTSFTEHLIEFISRSLTWQIRNDDNMPTAIQNVEQKLATRITSATGGLVRRFHSAGQQDQHAIKELMHQYHWVPYSSTTRLNDVDATTIPANLDSIIPYGAVIAFKKIASGNAVLVHITQPCDLLRFKERYHRDSLTFVEGKLIEYGAQASVGDSSWIIRAFKYEERYFDVEIQLKRSYIDTASVVVDFFRERHCIVVAQMRPDVTREIGQEFARRLTRIDRPVFSEIEIKNYYVLAGRKNESSQFIPSGSERLTVRAVIRNIPNDKKEQCFYLLDESAQTVAIWCQKNIAVAGMMVSEITDALKNELPSKGASNLGSHCGIYVLKDNEKIEKVQGLLVRMNYNHATNVVLVPETLADQIPE